jgi:hypothetical protein
MYSYLPHLIISLVIEAHRLKDSGWGERRLHDIHPRYPSGGHDTVVLVLDLPTSDELQIFRRFPPNNFERIRQIS